MLQNVVKPPQNQCMQLLYVLPLEKAACQPSADWVNLFESCNFIGAVALQGGPASAMRQGHDEEVPWAAGFRQEAGMAMGCSMG